MKTRSILTSTLLILVFFGLINLGPAAARSSMIFSADIYDQRAVAAPGGSYSISGQVKDGSGNPISGVSLTAKRLYNATIDGYSFQNWDAHTSWEIFRDTFGAENVEWNVSGKIVHKPAADSYYHDHYKCDYWNFGYCDETGMGGNCFGMAATSWLLYRNKADPQDFLAQQGVDFTSQLIEPTRDTQDNWNSSTLTDFLVQYQGYQEGQQYRTARSIAESRTLSETLALLKNGIDSKMDNAQVVEIFGPYQGGCAGQAILPYEYQISGDDTQFTVYDSNPDPLFGTHVNYLTINAKTNTWEYDSGLGYWQNGQHCGPLGLGSSKLFSVPLSTTLQHPAPPWLSGSVLKNTQKADDQWYELTVGKDATMTIEDNQGRLVGLDHGQLAMAIPGAYQDIPLDAIPGQSVNYPERYVIPSSFPLTVTINYSNTGQVPFNGLLPGGIVDVMGSSETGAGTDTLFLSTDAHQISLHASTDGADRMLSIIKEWTDYGRQAVINQFALSPGGDAGLSLEGNMEIVRFRSSQSQSGYHIQLDQNGKSTSSHFEGDGPAVVGGDVHVIQLNWAHPVTAAIGIDRGGTGTIVETVIIQNQASQVKTYLPLVNTGGVGKTFSSQDPIYGRISSSTQPEPMTGIGIGLLSPNTGSGLSTISLYTVTTSSNGYFTFSNLVNGTYVIMPVQSGKIFNPVTQTISIPPTTNGKVFTCTNCGGPVPLDMVTIPAGNFQMGCSPNDTGCAVSESPLHTVNLDAYDIDKYEVTNARYKACVDGGGCTAPGYSSSNTRPSYYGYAAYDNYPVIYVDWNQATAFCAWEGKRLPTEAEWEKAARGSSNTHIYPWGDEHPACTLGNFAVNGYCVGDTSQVGSYPSGASPYGALDMAGNVWEWVSDWYQADYYSSQMSWSNPSGPTSGTYKVLRGGAWLNDWGFSRVSLRLWYLPPGRSDLLGFRCVHSR
jgi:formylglycine-generating enzyme required for sulfatase activity